MKPLTESQKRIMRGEICPYCGKPSKYIDSVEIYGVSYGMIYCCRPCDAYVGVHVGTNRAKGRLANAGLRKWKREAHKYFDHIWKSEYMGRKYAYKWLSGQLGIPAKHTHIGMFGIDTCKKVVATCQNYLSEHE